MDAAVQLKPLHHVAPKITVIGRVASVAKTQRQASIYADAYLNLGHRSCPFAGLQVRYDPWPGEKYTNGHRRARYFNESSEATSEAADLLEGRWVAATGRVYGWPEHYGWRLARHEAVVDLHPLAIHEICVLHTQEAADLMRYPDPSSATTG